MISSIDKAWETDRTKRDKKVRRILTASPQGVNHRTTHEQLPAMSLSEKLDKIRNSPKLQNQQQVGLRFSVTHC